jgi:tripartite-type tricarboxylate transporter receptor subunit TctC
MKSVSLLKEGKNSPVSRPTIFILLIVASFLWTAPEIMANEYPTRPINIIVPWPPGSSTDFIPRTLAPKLSQIWGVPVTVTNKPGGSGIIGCLEAVKAAPDGYTVMAECPGTSSIQYAWVDQLPYKVEDRTYVVRAISTLEGMVVRADAPWKTAQDVMKEVQKNPARFCWSLSGGTATPDVLTAQFKTAIAAKGIDLSRTKTVAFQGLGQVMNALGGGHVDIAFSSPPPCAGLLSAGKVRVIAVAGKERCKSWPGVSTTVEQGFPSVNFTHWVGFAAAPGLPRNITQAWIEAVKAALADPEILSKFANLGVVPAVLGGEDFGKFVVEEGKMIKALKLR